jgi:hypothetical protein
MGGILTGKYCRLVFIFFFLILSLNGVHTQTAIVQVQFLALLFLVAIVLSVISECNTFFFVFIIFVIIDGRCPNLHKKQVFFFYGKNHKKTRFFFFQNHCLFFDFTVTCGENRGFILWA